MSTQKSSVFVTGASRGLGLEMVRQMAESSDWVDKIYAAARQISDGLKTVMDSNSQVHYIQLDVTDEAGIKRAAAEVTSDLGLDRGLNYLINNSGIGSRKTLEEIEAADINNVFNVNVTGPTIITKEFSPLLKKAHQLGGAALIVNFGSSVGSLTITDADFAFAYRMSKAALHMLSLCTNIHLRESGVHAFSLHPGWVQTDMGGANANQTSEQSIRQCLAVVKNFKTEEYQGRLVNFEGKVLPW